MNLTDFHAKYFAYELTKRSASDSVEKLVGVLVDAQVDLNPHQVEAALFAFRSPFSKGAVLADEVGLGKTVEAGLLIKELLSRSPGARVLYLAPARLVRNVRSELDRLGLTAGKPRPNPWEPGRTLPPPPPVREVKIAGVVWPVPPATTEIFARFSGDSLAPFLDEKERQRITLGLDKGALAEYECIQHAPYVEVAMTENYFFLLLRLDDEKPHDPTLYMLDHEDFKEHQAGSLSSLIGWLKAAQPAPKKDATG